MNSENLKSPSDDKIQKSNENLCVKRKPYQPDSKPQGRNIKKVGKKKNKCAICETERNRRSENTYVAIEGAVSTGQATLIQKQNVTMIFSSETGKISATTNEEKDLKSDYPLIIGNEKTISNPTGESIELQESEIVPCKKLLHRIPCMGIMLALLSTFTITVSALFKKLSPDVHPLVFILYSNIAQMVAITPVLVYRKVNIAGGSWQQRKLLYIRAFLGCSVINLAYVSVHYIPLGDSTVIRFSSPVFVGVLACIFLKEHFGAFEVFFILISTAGVVMVVKPNFLFGGYGNQFDTLHEILGYALVVGAMLLSCVNFILIKKLKNLKTHPSLLVFFVSIFGIIQNSIILVVLGEVPYVPCSKSVYYVTFNGFIFCLTQILVTQAIYLENAGIIAIVRTNSIVVAFFFDIAILKQTPSILTFVGAVMVTLSIIGVGIRKWLAQSKKMRDNHQLLSKILGIN